MELREIKFLVKSPSGGFSQEYTMKEALGEEDLAYQFQFTNPINGQLNMRNLWMKRLSRCLIPSIPETELVKLPRWHLMALCLQWNLMNEPTVPEQNNFLEESQPEKNP